MSLFRSSLVRQLMGALVGGGLALLVYAGYQAAAPEVRAYVKLDQWQMNEPTRFSRDPATLEDNQYHRQAQRNMELFELHGAAFEEGYYDAFESIGERAKEIQGEFTDEQEAQMEVELEGEQFGDAPQSEDEEGVYDPTGEIFGNDFPPEASVTPPPKEETTTTVEDVWEQEWDEAERVAYEGSEELPDSGIGMWLALFGALAFALALRQRKAATSALCTEGRNG